MGRRNLKKHQQFQFFAIILIVAIATIWLGILGRYIWQQLAPVNQVSDRPVREQPAQPPASSPSLGSPPPTAPPISASPIPETPTASPPFTSPDNPPVSVDRVPSTEGEPLYNHLPYAEASGDLVKVGTYYDRDEAMVAEAAQAYWQMEDAAKTEGISLGPISGFRTVGDQQQLFQRQIKRQNGSKQAAAKLSAPPGYSEHHTGYTIDIRDRDQPDTDLRFAMEETAAYRWLTSNACRYGFELSFPADNSQGVSFEPWHWRYIGSASAQRIFANAHRRYTAPSDCA